MKQAKHDVYGYDVLVGVTLVDIAKAFVRNAVKRLPPGNNASEHLEAILLNYVDYEKLVDSAMVGGGRGLFSQVTPDDAGDAGSPTYSIVRNDCTDKLLVRDIKDDEKLQEFFEGIVKP